MRNRILIILFATIIHTTNTGLCQCTSTGPTNGSNFANDATVGTLTWSNTANAKTSNNQYATASVSLLALASVNTEYLTAENFGFTIPASATICGIQVDVEYFASGITGLFGVTLGSISDNSVKIIKGGLITGTEHQNGAAWTGTNAYTSYGSSSDMWGVVTWLPADINAADFGVAISANLSALVDVSLTANIDNIRITVSYQNAVLSSSLQNFAVTKNQNKDLISWTVESENDFTDFVIQRSNDAHSWENIDKVFASNGETQYSAIDEYPLNGINYYRLQTNKKDGTVEYSYLRSVFWQSGEAISIYPNPASSLINISSKNIIHSIAIKDMEGRILKSYIANNSSQNIQLNISGLAAGFYVLQVDKSLYKFLKK
jgi:hypothetical protein